MTEIPIPPDSHDYTVPGGPVVLGWSVAARLTTGHLPGPDTYVWTVPAGVTSISMLIVGGCAGYGSNWSPPSHARRFFRRVPVVPGTEWLMECGGSPAYIQPVAPGEDSRAVAGRGGSGHPFGWGYGLAGGGGTLVGPRGGGEWGDWWAVAGGRGGVSSNRVPPGWEGTYGTPADQVAGDHYSDPTDLFWTWGGAPAPSYVGEFTLDVASGGGGGGYVGGAAPGAWLAGENGRSYWPPVTTLGGGPSPSMAECQTTDVPPADDAFGNILGLGQVRWWWYGKGSGWSTGRIGW